MAWLWDLYPTQSPVTSIGKARESEAWQYGSRGQARGTAANRILMKVDLSSTSL